MPRILIATGNPGKLAEFRALLGPRGFEVVGQRELGIDDPEETGATFVENALLKARHASALSGLPALADDSGLCVDALGGAPGLYSARFAGPQAGAADNMALLLERLAGVPAEERSAHFVCVLAWLRHPGDPDPLIASGRWPGRILEAPRGEGGFGYDPLFLDPASGLSAAELSAEDKHARSHRGRALRQLIDALPD
ncbi:RdgB/HAM1 family non-canonical purine NTP pyrophosphatase [Pseudomarimonas salicorniae]|uniref:dITP/XTP pyrophosphatase n=1 Tax=Pseudomarimonas salicorniae TaxID=2933270 RepID=A0ABT0GIW6_9GAMM|nr:RdgB/HAM1 family non-canonical purine NTP pyrophosphatase [Lysobacter sp. CAU 1642]MCK7594490.1 RdgB/HAM1 family non-canonical purine NTP pyrophosphatase [Lysobacter sp. CAU 1642]